MMDEQQLQRVVAALRMTRSLEWPRFAGIRAYLRNEVADIYVPKEATKEYHMLVDQSKFNVLPLVRDALAQALFVDGYRPTGPSGRAPTSANSPIWDEVWQPNRMDARQKAIHKAAISYGAAFATVLPGDPVPVIRPYSPFRCTTLYEDPINDEWPVYAMTVDNGDALTGQMSNMIGPERALIDPLVASVLGGIKVRIYDDSHVYTLEIGNQRDRAAVPTVISSKEHGLGVCPVVRYLDSTDADGDSVGKIEPLIPLQRQLNQTTFGLMIAQQYQAFRQRWATGMAIDTDEAGNDKQPWNAAVNAVWANDSPDGKFGDFAETNLAGYLTSRDRQLMFVAAVGQTPPHSLVLGAGISNISAEALAALGSSSELDRDDHQTTFGESHEQTLRLAGKALGTPEGMEAWKDRSGQVVWRDTTPRSLAQIADALGKLATQLDIPPQALWERIPGVTDQDIARWLEMARERDLMGELAAMTEGESGADGDGEGLEGVEFTGAVPTSLRLPAADADQLEVG